jgi:predicted nucleic acid-binding protein
VSVFVDTSAWYAAVSLRDAHHKAAKRVLSEAPRLVTTDHVLIETWRLICHRISWSAAESFWDGLRQGVAEIEMVGLADLQVAWEIGRAFKDQEFSIFDRTSFAVMQRLGLFEVVTYDSDFAVYRFGPGGRRAFNVIR